MSILYHDSKHPFLRRTNTKEISSLDPKGKLTFLEIISDSSTTKTKFYFIFFSTKSKVLEVNLLENNLRWLPPTTVFFYESIRILTIVGFTV